jgi:hypothetical protein
MAGSFFVNYFRYPTLEVSDNIEIGTYLALSGIPTLNPKELFYAG